MTVLQKLSKRHPSELKMIAELGRKALADPGILQEALALLDDADKNIRIGAIGILREAARPKPEFVVGRIDKIIEALHRPEKPTRWIATDILASCAPLAPVKIEKAIPTITKYMNAKDGICLIAATARFLGAFGKVDRTKAKQVFPYLENALKEYPINAVGFVIDSFGDIAPLLDKTHFHKVVHIAETYAQYAKSVIRTKAARLANILKGIHPAQS